MAKEKKEKHFIKKPTYPGGPKALRQFIRENLEYPKEALANKIEGTVVLKFTIDYKGNVTDTQVIAGLGYGCDEEAERLARLLKYEVPGSGRKVRVQFHKDLQIHFRLPKQRQVPQKKSSIVYTYTPGHKEKPTQSYSYTITLPGKRNKPIDSE